MVNFIYISVANRSYKIDIRGVKLQGKIKAFFFEQMSPNRKYVLFISNAIHCYRNDP